MLNKNLKDNQKFINEYFSLLFQNKNVAFPQSIIFFGDNIFTQYLLALNLAKILNCKETKDDTCNCLNCKWIKNNTHPEITTVSKIDFKPDDDNAKTVISVKQTQAIKNLLVTSNENHRVFIFCDAEIKTPSLKERKLLNEFKSSNYCLPFENEEEDKYWIPSGINSKTFQAESANSMLKIIEEPPPKTTFIFLTKDKNDLIETIISRSQCFYVPSAYIEDTDTEIIKSELKYYPEIDRLEINNITENLLKKAKDQNLNEYELITKFEQFIKQYTLANANNPNIVVKMIDDIKTLQKTQAHIKAYVNPKTALENALYQIYKNWNE